MRKIFYKLELFYEIEIGMTFFVICRGKKNNSVKRKKRVTNGIPRGYNMINFHNPVTETKTFCSKRLICTFGNGVNKWKFRACKSCGISNKNNL